MQTGRFIHVPMVLLALTLAGCGGGSGGGDVSSQVTGSGQKGPFLPGAQVTAWTLDADTPEQVALARRLAALGVDRITTNDAPALTQALAEPVP